MDRPAPPKPPAPPTPLAPPNTQDVSEALRALRERYRASVPNTVAGFRYLAAQLTVAPYKREVLESLRRELHRVHGTAGSFGYVTPVNIRILLAKIPSSLVRAAAP